MKSSKAFIFALTGAVYFGLAGCATSKSGAGYGDSGPMFVYDRGIDFPSVDKARYPAGYPVDPEAFKKLFLGVGKDQVQDVLGERHFDNEDFTGWHRWDYVFKLADADHAERLCQYQVQFFGGQAYRGFWSSPECRDMAARAAGSSGLGIVTASACAPADVPAPLPPKLELPADALFDFDKGDFDSILPAGRKQLNSLASTLKGRIGDIAKLTVVGYTDRLGGDDHNHRLSDERANSVREYLIDRGIPASKVTSYGRGAADPIVVCDDQNQNDLIRCLQKNRRVEIHIDQSSAK